MSFPSTPEELEQILDQIEHDLLADRMLAQDRKQVPSFSEALRKEAIEYLITEMHVTPEAAERGLENHLAPLDDPLTALMGVVATQRLNRRLNLSDAIRQSLHESRHPQS